MNRGLLIAVFLLLAVQVVSAQASAIFKDRDGIAIKGYDPVAFFTKQQAVKGTDSIQLSWNNATWLFSTSANRDLFRNAPEQYAPQFGGYCAYGVAGNHKSPTETDTWTIVNGKLYFNYNQSVKSLWLKDTMNLIPKADSLWTMLRDK